MSKSVVVTLRVDQEVYNQYKAQAESEDIPITYVLRRVLKRGINAESKPQVKSTTATLPSWE